MSAVVRAPAGPDDWDGYVAVAGEAFSVARPATEGWLAAPGAGDRISRVAVEGRRVVGGAIGYLLDQRFGGRAVPAGAIGGVCVAAHRRGRGLARELMRALDRALREAGVAVAPLWPSTLRLYRRLGWEVAGPAHRWSVDTARLEGLRSAGEPVPDPGEAFRAAHSAAVAPYDGPLHRPDWWWGWRWPESSNPGWASGPPGNGNCSASLREFPMRDDLWAGYGWSEEGRPAGLMRLLRDPDPPGGGPARVIVTELWTATAGALAGLLGLLGGESAQAGEVSFAWYALPPAPDLLWALPELPLRSSGHEPWMLRLVDPGAAIAARGWPVGAEARVELEVHDPLHDSRERLVLEVAAGAGRAATGGSGRVRIGAGALAAWYAGGLSATRAARIGLAEGPEADLQTLDALTGDRPVWLSERF